jgi:hypothetical protein
MKVPNKLRWYVRCVRFHPFWISVAVSRASHKILANLVKERRADLTLRLESYTLKDLSEKRFALIGI